MYLCFTKIKFVGMYEIHLMQFSKDNHLNSDDMCFASNSYLEARKKFLELYKKYSKSSDIRFDTHNSFIVEKLNLVVIIR